jgi:hypothetical protein
VIQRDWQAVVAALRALGCVVVRETEYRVTVCRGGTILQHVSKVSPVPVKRQRHLVETLGYTEEEYEAAIRG